MPYGGYGGNKKSRKVSLAKKKSKAKSRDQTSLIPKKYQNAMWDIGMRAAKRGAAWLICNKYKDQNMNTAPGAALQTFNSTGAFYQVNNINQGDLTNEREGKSIHMKSLYLKFTVIGAASQSRNRLIVVRSKGSVNTTSVATFTTDLFDNSGGYVGSSIFGPIDHNSFEILYDKSIISIPGTETLTQSFETTIPLNSMKVDYNENTAAPAYNSIFIYAVGNLVGGTGPDIEGFSRLLFTDG